MTNFPEHSTEFQYNYYFFYLIGESSFGDLHIQLCIMKHIQLWIMHILWIISYELFNINNMHIITLY